MPSVILPLAASALVVFGAPYIGQLRGRMQSAFPAEYRTIVGATIAIAVALAIVAAVSRIRQRHKTDGQPTDTRRQHSWRRYALIACAVSVAAIYAWSVRTGNVDVDLVEAVHFVEYGVITWLFYRVWRRRPDAAALMLPACSAVLVGIADESVQWFVPGRVGELHDVWLDAAAIGCGLLFSVAIDPPAALRWPRHRSGRFVVAAALSCVIVAMATFVDRVHLGHRIAVEGDGSFLSQYEADDLEDASADRAIRWQTTPPPQFWFSREDHYLSEGLWHVQERNLAESAGDAWIAWNENRILERFYGPVLDSPHAVGGPLEARWRPEQISRMEENARKIQHAPFVSDAAPYPIYLIRRSTLWLSTLVLAALVSAASVGLPRLDSSLHEAPLSRS